VRSKAIGRLAQTGPAPDADRKRERGSRRQDQLRRNPRPACGRLEGEGILTVFPQAEKELVARTR
jgi:hypothetical protein